MLKVYNDSALYVSQGGGKRKGSTAVYLEPWHADIFEFLDLKKPIGDEYLRARDLFLALWIPDLFMKRLIESIDSMSPPPDDPEFVVISTDPTGFCDIPNLAKLGIQ